MSLYHPDGVDIRHQIWCLIMTGRKVVDTRTDVNNVTLCINACLCFFFFYLVLLLTAAFPFLAFSPTHPVLRRRAKKKKKKKSQLWGHRHLNSESSFHTHKLYAFRKFSMFFHQAGFSRRATCVYRSPSNSGIFLTITTLSITNLKHPILN